MNYIIDGHNLIAQVHGLDLSMPDDEQRLIELLNRYCQLKRHKIEVYFDGAPVGQAGTRNYGRVRAHFVPQSSTADNAIRKRLLGLGRSARNWSLVSSDRSVQAVGHESHAQVMSSEDFARQLLTSLQQNEPSQMESAEPGLSEAEIKEWLKLFSQRGKRK